MTRTKAFNHAFPPHPEPVPLSPDLLARVMHLRQYYWLGLIAALIPLIAGYFSLKYGNPVLGAGLFLAAAWSILSKSQVLLGGQAPPWNLDMAQKIQLAMNGAKSDDSCCSSPNLSWWTTAIVCDTCLKQVEVLARPDLGRPRADGVLKGTIRLIFSDGYPMISSTEETKN